MHAYVYKFHPSQTEQWLFLIKKKLAIEINNWDILTGIKIN